MKWPLTMSLFLSCCRSRLLSRHLPTRASTFYVAEFLFLLVVSLGMSLCHAAWARQNRWLTIEQSGVHVKYQRTVVDPGSEPASVGHWKQIHLQWGLLAIIRDGTMDKSTALFCTPAVRRQHSMNIETNVHTLCMHVSPVYFICHHTCAFPTAWLNDCAIILTSDI